MTCGTSTRTPSTMRRENEERSRRPAACGKSPPSLAPKAMPSDRPFLAGRCRRRFALSVLLACWAHGPAAVAAAADQPRSASEGVASKARALTEKLGGSHAGHFLVGMGNDGTNSGDDPAYELGINLDLHYHYLVGLSTEGGWPTWN